MMESFGHVWTLQHLRIGTVCCKYRKVKFRNATNPDDAAPTVALGIVCTAKWMRLLHMQGNAPRAPTPVEPRGRGSVDHRERSLLVRLDENDDEPHNLFEFVACGLRDGGNLLRYWIQKEKRMGQKNWGEAKISTCTVNGRATKL